MRKLLCILAVLVAVTLPTFAQKATVFAGYSYINVDVSETKGLQTPGQITNRVSLNGWNAQGAYLLSPHFALAADFGGYYGTPKISGLDFKTKAHTFLFGPAVLTKKGKFMPSAHILFGGSTMTATEKSSNTDVVNGTHFSWAGGGALDYVASKRVAIRLAQLDYVGTKMSLTDDIQTSFKHRRVLVRRSPGRTTFDTRVVWFSFSKSTTRIGEGRETGPLFLWVQIDILVLRN